MNQSVLAYIVGAAIALGGLGFLAVGIVQHQAESALASHGVRVTGSVDRRLQHNHHVGTGNTSQSDITYSLLVDYQADGRRVEVDFPCTALAYDEYPEGSSIPVEFDSEDPGKAQLGGSLNDGWSGYTLIGSSLAIVIGSMLIVYQYLTAKNEAIEDEGDPSSPANLNY